MKDSMNLRDKFFDVGYNDQYNDTDITERNKSNLSFHSNMCSENQCKYDERIDYSKSLMETSEYCGNQHNVLFDEYSNNLENIKDIMDNFSKVKPQDFYKEIRREDYLKYKNFGDFSVTK